MILDPSFLIDVLRRSEAATGRERELDDRGAGIVTAITTMERRAGLLLANASEPERTRGRRLLDGLLHADVDHDSAMAAGEINATVVEDGPLVDVKDGMIGGTRRLDEPVLTGNPSHFERLPGVAVETY